LRFDAEQAALVFPAAWLKFALHSADHKIQHQVEAMLEAHERSEFTTRARRAMRVMLARGQLSEDHLAHHFSVSRRTLIRQLQQEGTSFHVLLKEMRHEVACLMLRDTDNTINHIATRLGYVGASSFTRAFKTWNGHTPADWRNRNAAGPVSR
jgi:AraC-like DNA-binding protein